MRNPSGDWMRYGWSTWSFYRYVASTLCHFSRIAISKASFASSFGNLQALRTVLSKLSDIRCSDQSLESALLQFQLLMLCVVAGSRHIQNQIRWADDAEQRSCKSGNDVSLWPVEQHVPRPIQTVLQIFGLFLGAGSLLQCGRGY